MKAIPQKPGPNGSRVIKKRPSCPRLGDGLADLISKMSFACGGNGFDSDTPSGHSNTTSPSPTVKSYKSTAVSTENEDVGLNVRFTPRPDLPELDSTRFNAALETSVPKQNIGATNTFQSELYKTNSIGNVAVSMDSSIGSGTHVSLVYDSSFTSSDDTPLDYMSTTSGDGVRLPSSTSTPCTPYEDFDEQSIQSSPKTENGQLHHTNTYMFEAAVNCAGYREPAPKVMNKLSDSTKTTHHITSKYRICDANAGKAPTSFQSITTYLDHQNITAQCPMSNSCETPRYVTVNSEAIDPMATEARLLDSYEKGEMTLLEAKHIAKQNQLWVLLATLEERESRSAAAFGMPTLSQYADKMNEFTRRQGNNTVGLGQNIVPTSIAYLPCPAWSDFKLLPTYSKSMFPSAEEVKLARFHEKLGVISSLSTSISTQKPVHIFVDMSNIFIGFCDSWKISQGIPVHQFIKAPAFNFKAFSSIMQRGRAITKRILAGSVAGVANERHRWPRHLAEASESGYEMNIFNRVQKPSPGSKSKRRGKSPPQAGAAYSSVEAGITSGDESPEDVSLPKAGTKNAEQGVDENLHLNMMNSMLDCMEPETMVLATGDAAQAEFSGGFLQYATRALDRGWNLELITWKKTISSAWTTPIFLEKYTGQFRIIFLDDFLEELNADLSPCLTRGFES